MEIAYVCLSVLLTGSPVVLGWSANGEMAVRQDYIETDTYHYLVRPNATVQTKVGLSILTINGLDNTAQQFSVTGWLTVEWNDERLSWTPDATYDADHVYSTFGEIWIPELFIDNSVEDVSVLYDENLFLRVTHTGRVDLDYPRIFHITCNVDVTSFPFDTQTCVLELTSWAYTIEELDLMHLLPEVNARLLSPNGEWTYLGSSVDRDVIIETTPSGQMKYAMLRYIMKLERKRAFYVTNIILPVTLTAILNVLVFMIPNDSGEKIGYALTILLALAVLLTMIADSMPHTSLHLSVLSFYLALTLCVSVFCVACSVVILRLYLKDPNEERPGWAKFIWRHVGFLVRSTVYQSEKKFEHVNVNGDSERKPLSSDTGTVMLDNIAEMIPTWADVANAMDWIAFFVNTAVIVFATIIIMIILQLLSQDNATPHSCDSAASKYSTMHVSTTMHYRLSSLVCLLMHASCVACWSSRGELDIRKTVFKKNVYNRMVRPDVNMTAKVGLNLLSINDLSMVDQSMSVIGWLTVEWYDHRLEWAKANYDDVDHIYASDNDVWKPELFIDNSVDDVSILQDDNLLFRVADTGKVDWEMPQIFVTSCTIDTTYYPFDTQECAIDVTSWAYTMAELDLFHLWEDINVEDLVENGEWLYVTSRVEMSVITDTTATDVKKFSLLKFVVILTRRYDYYVTNVVLPVLITSFLVTLVFILPVDSGEKVSYSVTVLLALAVLLTLIADSMPSTSICVSILSVYLAFTMIMGVLAVGLSVLVLRIHFKDPENPVPVWLHKITRRLFARGACWRGYCCCRNRKESPNMMLLPQYSEEYNRAILMYSWPEIAAIFDWFLFVVFFWSTLVSTVVFMIFLRIGGTIH
ncbi:uncharacterized protein LOC110453448 [Mizuhopecten yessoensis]|uniref:uncharacterized protein LOC110453448 n=1 Tax=Mizuhopecten yessoensis TaxID=6573 RepID=UPI000B45D30A|nr:uncharacterized protein LOC110453448 [Mizuhopecten yessoensis]